MLINADVKKTGLLDRVQRTKELNVTRYTPSIGAGRCIHVQFNNYETRPILSTPHSDEGVPYKPLKLICHISHFDVI